MNGLSNGVLDYLQTPIFDTYTAAQSASVPNIIGFFNSRTKSANGPHITNMDLAGQLMAPENFKVYGMSFTTVDADAADLSALIKNYTARLVIGGKTYLEAPIDCFPAIGGISGFAATTATTTTIKQLTNGVPSQASQYAIAPDLAPEIASGDVFKVELIGSTGFTAAAAVHVRCYLLGVWGKQVR